jgi:acetylornithine deacetylase/succinyl-diaminopimelate desuccinylase-like protein
VAQHRERFLEELIAYCRIPSVSAEGRGLEAAMAWASERLEAVGATIETIGVPGGAPMIMAELGPTAAAKTLLIYNHYDVQPPDPLELWHSPPFQPTVRDGRLYARGVADNKANFLSRVQAVEAWQVVRGALPLRLCWLVEGEEETGSRSLPAVSRVHGRRWSQADGCLWETGYKDEHGRAVLYSGVKGIASFELRARGANADKHSSLATLLPSPAWRLVWALATLKAPDETLLLDGLMDHVAGPSAVEREFVERIPYDDAEMRATHGVSEFVTGVTGHEALVRHLFQPTCTICGIHSGYGGPGMKTVLPHQASAKLDFRLVADLTPALVAGLLRAHLDRHGFADIEVLDLGGEHPARGQVDSAVVRAAMAAVREVTGVEPVLWPHMAATGPMHPVAAQFGIPCVGFGTGYYNSGAHAPNEHIRLDDYFEGILVAAAFFAELARIPSAA